SFDATIPSQPNKRLVKLVITTKITYGLAWFIGPQAKEVQDRIDSIRQTQKIIDERMGAGTSNGIFNRYILSRWQNADYGLANPDKWTGKSSYYYQQATPSKVGIPVIDGSIDFISTKKQWGYTYIYDATGQQTIDRISLLGVDNVVSPTTM